MSTFLADFYFPLFKEKVELKPTLVFWLLCHVGYFEVIFCYYIAIDKSGFCY